MDVAYVLSLVSNFADVLALISAIFAVAAWYQARKARREATYERNRLAQPVAIMLRLVGEDREITLPVSLRRADVSRAEVLGRLGMIPMREKGKRFSIKHLGSNEFLVQLDALREGNGTQRQLVIPCSVEEIEQFELQP